MNVATAALILTVLLSAQKPADAAIRQQLTLESCPDRASSGCTPFSRWRAASDARVTVQLVAEFTNADSNDSDFFVLTATDFLIAPQSKFSAADFDRLKTGSLVAWGQLESDNDVRAVVIRDLKHGSTRRLAIRELTPAALIADSFSDTDQLWPWLIRFRVVVLDRQGMALSTSSIILELEPRPRDESDESPNPSLQRTTPGHSPGCCR